MWSRSYRRPWPRSWGFRIAVPWTLINDVRLVNDGSTQVPGLVLRDFEALEGVPQGMKRGYYLQSDRVFRVTIRFSDARSIVSEIAAYKRASAR